MYRTIFFLILLALTAFFGLSLQAQVRTPQPSPTGSFEQAVGLSIVSLEYSRPGVKGRTIFGDLVPYGEVWRTGANQSTQITFSDDVTFGGKEVAAGAYALYTIPGKDEWTVMLYNDLSLGGNVSNYDESREYMRFSVEPQAAPMAFETMTFMLNDIKNNSANLYLLWDQTMVVMPIEVPVDERVMTQIERVMNGPSASDYFAAAVYYYNTDRDMEQALEWIDQALADNQRYWIMTWKARILGKMENYEQGLSVAQTAMKMAKESDNPDYVKINQDLIAAFKQKM